MTLLDTPPQETAEPAAPPSAARMWRALGFAALCPLIAGYAVLAALLALVSALASNASFATLDVLLAAGPGWLAAALVPLHINGAPLGVLPLLLTAFLLLLAERGASAAADRLGPGSPREAVPILATISGAHAVFGTTIAVLCGDGPVTAQPAVAFFGCAALAGLGATLGVRNQYGFRAALRSRMDDATALGIRTGLLALPALFLAGALLFVVSLLISLPAAGDLLAATAPGAGDSFGVLLLCLVYLPNVVLGAGAFLLGPGFGIGALQANPFAFTGAAVPGLPVFAALPAEHAHWWPALLVVPLLVGAAVGWQVRRTPELRDRIRAVSVAALVVGSGCLVLAAVAGGPLGAGTFTPVRIPAGLLAVAGFGWIAVPGVVVATPGGKFRKRVHPRPVAEDITEPANESDPVDEDAAEQVTSELDPANLDEPDEPPDAAEPGSEPDSAAEDSSAAEPEEDQFPADELGPPKGRTAADRA